MRQRTGDTDGGRPRPRSGRPPGVADVSRVAGGVAVPAAALLAVAALLASAPRPAACQPVDSAGIVEELEDRVRDFARHRRLRFPITGTAGRGRCEERVGRYCLFHDEEGEGWEPPPEHPDIAPRRRRLVDRLARAARRRPGDGWIAGQRVRYLMQDGRPGEAAAAARDCRAGTWWCRALEAFARHRAGAPGPADSLFDLALAAMPDSLRRRWLDPSVILEDEAADRWEGLEGERRPAWLERLWWLSDPLWSVPGSGRRTGHLARRVRCRIHRDADGPYGDAWGDDLAELTMRYGWPVGWQRVRPGPYDLGTDVPVVAHHDPSARIMIPPARVLEDPPAAGSDAWPLEPDEPHSEYAPPALDTLVRPPARLARFPRPDSLRLVAAWRWEEGDGARASLRVEAGPHGPAAARTGRQTGPTGRLHVAVRPGPVVTSLELVRAEERRAARRRVGVRPPDRPEGMPGLSDLLLTAPSGGTGAVADTVARVFRRRAEEGPTLARAAARARPPGAVRPGERLGLYWEAYGRSAELRGGRTEVRLVQAGGGLLEGLARGLGLADDPREVAIGWPTTPSEGGRVHPSGVALTLPNGLEPGRYAVEVTVRPPGREPLSARTTLRVAEPDEEGG